MLQIQNISVGYGKTVVLQNVSLNISDNKMATIIGKKGTGKTTLAKSLAGILKPLKGKILFNGNDICSLNQSNCRIKGLSYVPQRTNIFPRLTIHDNLLYASMTYNSISLSREKLKLICEFFPELRENPEMLVGTLDNRNRKLLSIAMELIQNPRLLIIDELSFGLDRNIAKKIIKKIFKVSKKLKSSILLTEQNLSVGLAVTEQVFVIHKQSVQESCELLRIPRDEGLLPLCVW